MAKRKEAENAAATKHIKKHKVSKEKPTSAKTKQKKDQGDGALEGEEKMKTKVRSNPRSSSKSTTVQSAPDSSTSKYFESPPRAGDAGDLHMVTAAMSTFPATVTGSVLAKKEESEEEDESDEDDWEEVEELSEPLGPVAPAEAALPTQPVEIEIETPDLARRRLKKEKRKAEFEVYLKRMVNRFNKDLLVDTHKVHLMCLIANGMFRNRLCSEPDLLAITLSLLPTHFAMVAKERIDQNYLSGLLKWFGATFTLNPSLPSEERPDPRALLERRLASLSARDHQEMTQPIPLKVPRAKGNGADGGGGVRPPGKSPAGRAAPKETPPDQPKVSPGAKRAAADGSSGGARGGKRAKGEEVKEEEEEGGREGGRRGKAGGQRPKNDKRRRVASKVSYKEESGSEAEEEEEEFQATSEDEDGEDSEGAADARKGKRTKGRGSGGGREERGVGDGKEEGQDDDDDDEGAEEGTRAKRRRGGRRRGRREGPGADEWLEVYVEKTRSWVCVDVEHGVGRPHLCSQHATPPITYVVAVDDRGRLKDLGRKYDPAWMTSSRKRRVDEDWWEETLEPFLGRGDDRDTKEDKELQARLLDKPLPVSIAEFKNHPLYALQRHLLKYEALYPPTAAILGYCRGEPVFSRDCVHQLHSSDTWLKEARTVRLGEEPYKMVKGFSNRSRKARMLAEQKEANDLPLFGEWQTEEYQPPVAVEGKVPRNEYGNVYLFKPCMLPVGCVHLRLPTLNRVARKLTLDAAPAVTGFDFHGGYSHAVTDGYVVCEEHEEILRAAWAEDQDIQKQKEREKREKRATSNWKLLVKGLLIRERLQRRYGKSSQGLGGTGASSQTHPQDRERGDGLSSGEEEEEEEGRKTESPGAKTVAETLAMAWPQNRQEEEEEGGAGGKGTLGLKKTMSRREKRGQEKIMFPFEKV